MLLAALPAIAKIWRQLKCLSIEERIRKWYINMMEYYKDMKKNEILPLATTRMDLAAAMLREISQTEKDKDHMISLVCGIQNTKTQRNTTQTASRIDTETKLMVLR